MSVQALSRIAALLALDAGQLRDYLPSFNDYDEDVNESRRAALVESYGSQLQSQEIKDILASGDLNKVFLYLAAHLEKPMPGGDQTSDGTSTGSGGG